MEGDINAQFGLAREPFSSDTDQGLFFPGEQQLRALAFMRDFLWSRDNVAVLTAPRGCGKSVLIRRFLDELDDHVYAAELHSNELDRRRFLKELLSQYGLELDDSDADLRHLLRTFLQHQRSMGRVCLLVLDNAQNMPAVVLDELGILAQLEYDREKVLKILMVGTDSLNRVVRSPGMASFLPRGLPMLALVPFTPEEVRAYVVHRLREAGAVEASTLIEEDAVHALCAVSGGVPETIHDLCRAAFRHVAAQGDTSLGAKHLRTATEELGLDWREVEASDLRDIDAPAVSRRAEVLFRVSIQGHAEREIKFDIPRMLIGRSQSADIRIHSMHVSRHHALLVRERNYDVLIDLGSTNGVLVNGSRVDHHVLADRDLIQIGPARLLYCCDGASGVTDDEFGSTVRFSEPERDRGQVDSPAERADERVVRFPRVSKNLSN
jgi:type II secretory pathway predicted ATPase ExeA